MTEEKNQRVRLTKRLFHESMISLLNEKSADRITVKELCERSELNRTTFYLHYSCCADVIEEMENTLISDTQKYLDTIQKSTKTIHILESLLDYISENRKLFDILLFAPGRDSFRRMFLEKVFPYLLPRFENGIDKEIRSYVNGFLSGGSFSVVYTWSLNGYTLPVSRVAELLYSMSHAVIQIYTENMA